jgi:hypothetical protein
MMHRVAVTTAKSRTPGTGSPAWLAGSADGHAVASTRADALGVLVRGIPSARLAQLLGGVSNAPGDWRDRFDKAGTVVVGSALARPR